MTTDRVLPPVSLSRHPGQWSTIATPSARPVARPTPVSSAAAHVQGPSRRRDAIGARLRQPSSRPTGVASAARLAKPRGDALLSTATRAGVLIGVSAAAYAVSLAAVAGLQAQTDAQAAAAAQPALDVLATTKAANDEMAAAIQAASARLQSIAHEYDATSADMAAYQAQFQQLSALVAKIQGSAAAINAGFKLPTVTMRGAVGSGGGGRTVVTTTSASGKP